MLQFRKEVCARFERINRELYKSESSKEDCTAVIPLKLLCTSSELVNMACEKAAPAKEENCMFEFFILQSENTEKSNTDICIFHCSQCIFIKAQF